MGYNDIIKFSDEGKMIEALTKSLNDMVKKSVNNFNSRQTTTTIDLGGVSFEVDTSEFDKEMQKLEKKKDKIEEFKRKLLTTAKENKGRYGSSSRSKLDDAIQEKIDKKVSKKKGTKEEVTNYKKQLEREAKLVNAKESYLQILKKINLEETDIKGVEDKYNALIKLKNILLELKELSSKTGSNFNKTGNIEKLDLDKQIFDMAENMSSLMEKAINNSIAGVATKKEGVIQDKIAQRYNEILNTKRPASRAASQLKTQEKELNQYVEQKQQVLQNLEKNMLSSLKEYVTAAGKLSEEEFEKEEKFYNRYLDYMSAGGNSERMLSSLDEFLKSNPNIGKKYDKEFEGGDNFITSIKKQLEELKDISSIKEQITQNNYTIKSSKQPLNQIEELDKRIAETIEAKKANEEFLQSYDIAMTGDEATVVLQARIELLEKTLSEKEKLIAKLQNAKNNSTIANSDDNSKIQQQLSETDQEVKELNTDLAQAKLLLNGISNVSDGKISDNKGIGISPNIDNPQAFVDEITQQLKGHSVKVDVELNKEGIETEITKITDLIPDKKEIEVSIKQNDLYDSLNNWKNEISSSSETGTLPEQVIAANTKTGYSTNPNIKGGIAEISSHLVNEVVDSASETVNAVFHSHPDELTSAFSFDDIKIAAKLLSKGITEQYVVSLNNIAKLDLSKFTEKDVASISTRLKELAMETFEYEGKTKIAVGEEKALMNAFNTNLKLQVNKLFNDIFSQLHSAITGNTSVDLNKLNNQLLNKYSKTKISTDGDSEDVIKEIKNLYNKVISSFENVDVSQFDNAFTKAVDNMKSRIVQEFQEDMLQQAISEVTPHINPDDVYQKLSFSDFKNKLELDVSSRDVELNPVLSKEFSADSFVNEITSKLLGKEVEVDVVPSVDSNDFINRLTQYSKKFEDITISTAKTETDNKSVTDAKEQLKKEIDEAEKVLQDLKNSSQNAYDNLLKRDFSTKNRTEAFNQLKEAFDTFKGYLGNELNSYDALYTEEGAKAGYAYYRAYEEALKKEVSEKRLPKVTLGKDEKEATQNAEFIVEKYKDEKAYGEQGEISSWIEDYEKQLLKFRTEEIKATEEYIFQQKLLASNEQSINEEIEKRTEILGKLKNLESQLIVHEDYHSNDRMFADELPTEEDIRKVDASIKELFGFNDIFDTEQLINERNQWLNAVKESLNEYDELVKTNNQKGLEEYDSYGMTNITNGADTFFQYSPLHEAFEEERERIEAELIKLYEVQEDFYKVQENLAKAEKTINTETTKVQTDEVTKSSNLQIPIDVVPNIEPNEFVQEVSSKLSGKEVPIDVVPSDNTDNFLKRLSSYSEKFEDLIKNQPIIQTPEKATQENLEGNKQYDASEEISGMNKLAEEVSKVTTAVDEKTEAFRKEGQVVTETVQKEISELERLSSQLFSIPGDIEKISTAITSLPKIDFDVDLSKLNIENIDNASIASFNAFREQLAGLEAQLNVSNLSSKLVEISNAFTTLSGLKLDNLNTKNLNLTRITKLIKQTEGIEKLADALMNLEECLERLKNDGSFDKDYFTGLKFSAKNVNNMADMAVALETVGIALRQFDKEAKDALSSINKLAENAEGLKNLSSIIKAPKKVKKVQEAIENEDKPKEPTVAQTNKATTIDNGIINGTYQIEVDKLTKRYERLSGIIEQADDRTNDLKTALGTLQKANSVEEKIEAFENFKNTITLVKNELETLETDNAGNLFAKDIAEQLHNIQEQYKNLSYLSDSLTALGTKIDNISNEARNGTTDLTKLGKQAKDAFANFQKGILPSGVQTGGFNSYEDAIAKARELVNSYTKVKSELKVPLQLNDNGIAKMTAQVIDLNGQLKNLTFVYNDASKAMSQQTVDVKKELTGLPGAIDAVKNKLKDMAVYWTATLFDPHDIMSKFGQVTGVIIDLNTQMTELAKVSGLSIDQLENRFGKWANTAKELGATVSDTISATADWSRLGYSVEEAEKLAEVAILYKNVGDGIDIEAANESLVSTMQGFQLEANQAESVIDSFNEVSNNFAINSAGIGEALQRSASSFYAANTDLNSAIALITASNTVLQDPTRVGNMWKTKFYCLNVQKMCIGEYI